MTATLFTALLLPLAVFTAIEAISCSAVSSGDVVNDDVFALGGACILHNVTVNGNVFAGRSVFLITLSGTSIKGDIIAEGYYAVALLDGTSVQNVEAETGGPILINASSINAGLGITQSVGGLTVCGSTIKGRIYYGRSDGYLRLEKRPSCAKNSIFSEEIYISRGEGSVLIDGIDIRGNGKLSIFDCRGQVTIRNAQLNELDIEKAHQQVRVGNVSGNIALITANTGGVDITNSEFIVLNCVGNSPDITCSGSSVGLSLGQCSLC